MNSLMSQIVDEENLYAAWQRIRANQGGPGVDAMHLADFEARLPTHLTQLATALQDESYLPLGLRRVTIPKKSGGQRELAIPTVTDRVAQRAFVNVLEPLFEPIFLPCSFGYRPQRSVDDAVERVLAYRTAGLDWVLDADVRDFFSSVDHGMLRQRLQHHISDRSVLRVISLWLEAGALEATEKRPSLVQTTAERLRGALQSVIHAEDSLPDETQDWERPARTASLLRLGGEAARLAWDYRKFLLPALTSKAVLLTTGLGVTAVAGVLATDYALSRRRPRLRGTPQGSPLSPLLSNVYLHPFDEAMSRAGLRLVRYADDFVVCCPSEARARQAQELATREMERLRLTLHPEKTRILSCRDPLEFLGHAFDDDGALPIPAPQRRPGMEIRTRWETLWKEKRV